MNERTLAMRICLFEDRGVANLEPLTLTRPVFDLLCGQSSLRSKQCRYFAPCELGVLLRPYLVDLFCLNQPTVPINDLTWLRGETTVLVNGRWLPPEGGLSELPDPGVGMVGGEIAYVVVGPERLTYLSWNTLDECLELWKATLPHHEAGGRVARYLWDLVSWNAEQLCRDFAAARSSQPREGSDCPPSVVGSPDDLVVDPTARIDPLVVVDTTGGPVSIDREAVLTSFTRLEGPCHIGAGTQVLGARIRAGTTLGPQCRVGGEVEASIFLGHSNKYHDGFLGHSYLGEWINLGAGTQNSDLRNDYGDVSVVVNGQLVTTGQNKVGCFIGDHTKTGLGTLLNTGTHVGTCCNLLPSGSLLPKYIPSFCSWWNGALSDQVDLPRLLNTAACVMQRRGSALTAAHAALIRELHQQTAAERHRAVVEAEFRHLRRTA
jgi:UDP-N-acetylglucosamine diphosphorylase/glucosamine-1-phosphate N-acetyltransferase